MLDTDSILDAFRLRGGQRYGGEAVTQLEHALQCASLAQRAGAPPELVAACLLHDLGHLVAPVARPEREDDRHQHRAMAFLRGRFPAAVTEPIRLHVEAKRYLCRSEPGYWESLSPASRRSLELQGGIFDDAQAQAFESLPHASSAIALRRYDDLAKQPGAPTPPLGHFEVLLRACERPSA